MKMFNRDKKSKDIESKEERFKRIASRRTQEILSKLRLLSNCSERGNYSYSEEQVRKIFSTIENSLKETKMKFNHNLKLNRKNDFKLE